MRCSFVDFFSDEVLDVLPTAKTYLQLLCTDTRCILEDLPNAMGDRNEWRVRIRESVHTAWHEDDGNIYVYLYIYIYIYIYINMCVCVCVYIYIYIKLVKLVTVVEGDPKAPFSIATTPRCRGGRYSFPWISPLYPWHVPYNAECKEVSSTIF